MHKLDILSTLKEAKTLSKLTINDISTKSGIGIRTVNRIFAGQDVRFSSIAAVLDALEIDLDIHIRQVA
jgi:predicted transcriptional regulator